MPAAPVRQSAAAAFPPHLATCPLRLAQQGRSITSAVLGSLSESGFGVNLWSIVLSAGSGCRIRWPCARSASGTPSAASSWPARTFSTAALGAAMSGPTRAAATTTDDEGLPLHGRVDLRHAPGSGVAARRLRWARHPLCQSRLHRRTRAPSRARRAAPALRVAPCVPFAVASIVPPRSAQLSTCRGPARSSPPADPTGRRDC
jgi:hypothetical protein